MSNNNNQGEPALVLLMVLALLAGLFWIFWHITHEFWLNWLFRWLRFGELWIINLFAPHYTACLGWLRATQVEDPSPSPHVVALTNQCFGTEFLGTQPVQDRFAYYQLAPLPIAVLGAVASTYYRWPFAAAMLGIIYYVLFLSPRNGFQTRHTLETLIKTQAKMWPIISPIVKFNPSKSGRVLGSLIPQKLPLFAEALSPEEWIAWCRIPVVNGIPDREASRRAFIRQLGSRWMGIESAPLSTRALFAIFALKGSQSRDESETLLGRVALAWSPEKGLKMDADLIGDIDKIIQNPEIGGRLSAIVTPKHAWRTTAMLGALSWARANGGVLAPAHFLWLRAEDRALWYPLNNLGRRAYHSEGAGAMAHFMAEQAAKKALPLPRVDTAIITLNTYLHDPDKRTVPIPPHENDVKV